jgi:hypothetical protein
MKKTLLYFLRVCVVSAVGMSSWKFYEAAYTVMQQITLAAAPSIIFFAVYLAIHGVPRSVSTQRPRFFAFLTIWLVKILVGVLLGIELAAPFVTSHADLHGDVSLSALLLYFVAGHPPACIVLDASLKILFLFLFDLLALVAHTVEQVYDRNL